MHFVMFENISPREISKLSPSVVIVNVMFVAPTHRPITIRLQSWIPGKE